MKPNERIAGIFLRTAELTNMNMALRALAVEHETAAELAARHSATSATLLDESRQLQQHLLDVTRSLLSVDELEHGRIGGLLQDQLLQTLVGIHIRLLALKKEVTVNSRDLNKHIASTRRLMRDSWVSLKKTVRAAASKHGN